MIGAVEGMLGVCVAAKLEAWVVIVVVGVIEEEGLMAVAVERGGVTMGTVATDVSVVTKVAVEVDSVSKVEVEK